MSNWSQWKEFHIDKIAHVMGFEKMFVDLVLSQIPGLCPDDVVPQYKFFDGEGIERRIDFMIINIAKGYLLPIELDGRRNNTNDGDIPNRTPKSWDTFLRRQNDLMRNFRTVLLRYSNSQMFNNTEWIIREISEELSFQERDKGRRDQLREVLASLTTPPKPATSPEPARPPVNISPPTSQSSWPAWRRALAACAVLFTTVVLGDFTSQNGLRRNFATQDASDATSLPIRITSTPQTSTSILSVRAALAEEQIEALRAPFHVGESVIACGKVAQVSSHSQVAYINLDRPYPNQTLGLVIWQSELPAYETRFGRLSMLEGKRVCARGKVEEYRKQLQLTLKNPQFLRLMNP